jgi:hypothetical protein
MPPVNGRMLFGHGEPMVLRSDRLFDPGFAPVLPPYDSEGFSAALRDGRHRAGRPMDTLMPRFDLDARSLEALAAYLDTLSAVPSPAVDSREVGLATVIAPGLDPARVQAFKKTLTAIVEQINVSATPVVNRKLTPIERRLRSWRRWRLDFIELEGAPPTWQAQLHAFAERKPMFALVSGLGGAEWAAVQSFCEQRRVVCWFPSLAALPRAAEQAPYSLYFSRGVELEAAVLARRLGAAAGRVVQWFGREPGAEVGARALRRELEGSGAVFSEVAWDAAPPRAADLQALRSCDVLVLWLSRAELAQSASAIEQTACPVYLSGSLAGDESAVESPSVRLRSTMVQLMEMPALRDQNLNRFDSWLQASRLPLVDRRMQSEVYFAARSFLAASRALLNNWYPDYLIEQAESGISAFETAQVQEELQSVGMAPPHRRSPAESQTREPDVSSAKRLEDMRLRRGTTAYPRLSLGPGQRIAAKGAYLEPLAAPGGLPRGEPEWVVP